MEHRNRDILHRSADVMSSIKVSGQQHTAPHGGVQYVLRRQYLGSMTDLGQLVTTSMDSSYVVILILISYRRLFDTPFYKKFKLDQSPL